MNLIRLFLCLLLTVQLNAVKLTPFSIRYGSAPVLQGSSTSNPNVLSPSTWTNQVNVAAAASKTSDYRIARTISVGKFSVDIPEEETILTAKIRFVSTSASGGGLLRVNYSSGADTGAVLNSAINDTALSSSANPVEISMINISDIPKSGEVYLTYAFAYGSPTQQHSVAFNGFTPQLVITYTNEPAEGGTRVIVVNAQ